MISNDDRSAHCAHFSFAFDEHQVVKSIQDRAKKLEAGQPVDAQALVSFAESVQAQDAASLPKKPILPPAREVNEDNQIYSATFTCELAMDMVMEAE